ADQSPRVRQEFSAANLPQRLDLYAWTARLRGEEIRYQKKSASASGFRRTIAEKNELWWYPYESLNGDYGVEVTYACANNVAGSPFSIVVRPNNSAAVNSEIRGAVEGTGGRFLTRSLNGTIHITPADDHISFGLPGDDTSSSMQIRK